MGMKIAAGCRAREIKKSCRALSDKLIAVQLLCQYHNFRDNSSSPALVHYRYRLRDSKISQQQARARKYK